MAGVKSSALFHRRSTRTSRRRKLAEKTPAWLAVRSHQNCEHNPPRRICASLLRRILFCCGRHDACQILHQTLTLTLTLTYAIDTGQTYHKHGLSSACLTAYASLFCPGHFLPRSFSAQAYSAQGEPRQRHTYTPSLRCAGSQAAFKELVRANVHRLSLRRALPS